ncbi:hypothetical protein [Shewanella algae]|uniref:hypothetical protein n=1 Tax=Shewanella algae TaxID=38313 RepID=UPI0031F4BDDF
MIGSITMEQLFFMFLAVSPAIWMMQDSMNHKMGGDSGSPSPFFAGAMGIIFGILYLIIFLVQRKKYILKATETPNENAGNFKFWQVLILAALFVGLFFIVLNQY